MTYTRLSPGEAVIALRDRAEEIRVAELARMRGTLGALSAAERETVELVTAQIIDRLLDAPSVRVQESETLVPLLCSLFGIEEAA